jgi:hypothetical protein
MKDPWDQVLQSLRRFIHNFIAAVRTSPTLQRLLNLFRQRILHAWSSFIQGNPISLRIALNVECAPLFAFDYGLTCQIRRTIAQAKPEQLPVSAVAEPMFRPIRNPSPVNVPSESSIPAITAQPIFAPPPPPPPPSIFATPQKIPSLVEPTEVKQSIASTDATATSPQAAGGERNALLDQIRKGAKLRSLASSSEMETEEKLPSLPPMVPKAAPPATPVVSHAKPKFISKTPQPRPNPISVESPDVFLELTNRLQRRRERVASKRQSGEWSPESICPDMSSMLVEKSRRRSRRISTSWKAHEMLTHPKPHQHQQPNQLDQQQPAAGGAVLHSSLLANIVSDHTQAQEHKATSNRTVEDQNEAPLTV